MSLPFYLALAVPVYSRGAGYRVAGILTNSDMRDILMQAEGDCDCPV